MRRRSRRAASTSTVGSSGVVGNSVYVVVTSSTTANHTFPCSAASTAIHKRRQLQWKREASSGRRFCCGQAWCIISTSSGGRRGSFAIALGLLPVIFSFSAIISHCRTGSVRSLLLHDQLRPNIISYSAGISHHRLGRVLQSVSGGVASQFCVLVLGGTWRVRSWAFTPVCLCLRNGISNSRLFWFNLATLCTSRIVSWRLVAGTCVRLIVLPSISSHVAYFRQLWLKALVIVSRSATFSAWPSMCVSALCWRSVASNSRWCGASSLSQVFLYGARGIQFPCLEGVLGVAVAYTSNAARDV